MKILQKFLKIIFSITLIFLVTNPSTIAKTSVKPHTVKPSSKPNATKNVKPTTNTKQKNSNTNERQTNYNSKNYKKNYTDYIHENYNRSGFFTSNAVTNALLWYTLFNVTNNNNLAHSATKEQQDIANNVKDSKVPVYMLEIKTQNGEMKYITVTKEEYEKVKTGDNISYKNNKLEIKN